jgi:hypothetical protein
MQLRVLFHRIDEHRGDIRYHTLRVDKYLEEVKKLCPVLLEDSDNDELRVSEEG